MGTVRTISSRVDVGYDSAGERRSKPKQPVLQSVRKLGSRIRGLFKFKGDTKPKGIESGGPPEFGMLTTVTNVEYESVSTTGILLLECFLTANFHPGAPYSTP